MLMLIGGAVVAGWRLATGRNVPGVGLAAQSDLFQRDLLERFLVTETLQRIKNFDSRQLASSVVINGNAFRQMLGRARRFFKPDVERIDFGIVGNAHQLSSLSKIVDIHRHHDHLPVSLDEDRSDLLGRVRFLVPDLVVGKILATLHAAQVGWLPWRRSDRLNDFPFGSSSVRQLLLGMLAQANRLADIGHASTITDAGSAVKALPLALAAGMILLAAAPMDAAAMRMSGSPEGDTRDVSKVSVVEKVSDTFSRTKSVRHFSEGRDTGGITALDIKGAPAEVLYHDGELNVNLYNELHGGLPADDYPQALIRRRAEMLRPGDRVLHVGSGGSWLPVFDAALGVPVTVTDLHPDRVRRSLDGFFTTHPSLTWLLERIRIVDRSVDVTRLNQDLAGEPFDQIVMHNVLHFSEVKRHGGDPVEALTEVIRALRPNGRLWVTDDVILLTENPTAPDGERVLVSMRGLLPNVAKELGYELIPISLLEPDPDPHALAYELRAISRPSDGKVGPTPTDALEGRNAWGGMTQASGPAPGEGGTGRH